MNSMTGETIAVYMTNALEVFVNNTLDPRVEKRGWDYVTNDTIGFSNPSSSQPRWRYLPVVERFLRETEMMSIPKRRWTVEAEGEIVVRHRNAKYLRKFVEETTPMSGEERGWERDLAKGSMIFLKPVQSSRYARSMAQRPGGSNDLSSRGEDLMFAN